AVRFKLDEWDSLELKTIKLGTHESSPEPVRRRKRGNSGLDEIAEVLARATHPRSDRPSKIRHCSHVGRVTIIDFDSGPFSAKPVLHPGNWPHYAQGSVTDVFETDGLDQRRLALRCGIVCPGRHEWPRW